MRCRTISLLLVPAVTAFLAACQTTFYDVGTTPITLSQKVFTGFEKYKQYEDPLFFAVATNGSWYSFRTCSSAFCNPDVSSLAINRCEERSGLECKIFANGRNIVWKGPITYPEVKADFLFLFAKMLGGSSTNYDGTGTLSDNGRKIDLSLRIGSCRGEANLATKKWFLRGCKNNYSANGTFIAGTGKEKYFGIGRSTTGGRVEIKLLDPKLPAGASAYDATKPAISKELPKELLEIYENASLIIGTKCVDDFKLHLERTLANKYTIFAYAQQKLGGAYSCSGKFGKVLEEVKTKALEACEKLRANYWKLSEVSCEIFAIGQEILWKGTQEQIEQVKSMPDGSLCSSAIDTNYTPPRWESKLLYSHIVREAQRRGHTVTKCVQFSE